VPKRPKAETSPEVPGTDGFSLRFSQGRGVLVLQDEDIAPAIRLEALEMAIPQIAFPFDVSKGVRGLRNRRLKLARLKVVVGLDALLSAAGTRLTAGSWVRHPKLSFQEDAVCVAADYGPPDSAMPVTFRLLPFIKEQQIAFVIDDVRGYGALPAPLLRIAAIITAELSGAGLDGISLKLQDPVRAALMRVLPRRGWRLPACDDLCLTGFELLPDRCELEWKSREFGTEDMALSKNRLSMDRLRRLEELRFSEEADGLLAAGELADARQACTRLLERTPDNPSVATRLGMLDVLNPMLRETVLRYLRDNDAAFGRRDDTAAVLAHGAAIGDNGDGEVEALSRLFEHSHPLEAIEAARRLGQLLQDRAPERAIPFLERALAARREDAGAMHLLIRIHARMKHAEKVAALIPGWIALHRDKDDQPDAHVQAGRLLLMVDDCAAAVRHFERAALAAPDSEEAAWGLAESLAGIGEVQRAIVGFEQLAVTCAERGDGSGAAAALSAIGEIWIRQGEPDLAIPRLRDALQKHWDSDTEALLAGALVALGRIDEGLLHYEEALSRDRRRDRVRGNWALTAARLYFSHREDYAGAERWLKVAATCEDTAEAAAGLQMQVLEKQKRWGELASTLEKELVRGTSPDRIPVETVLRLTRARVSAGEYQPAMATLESALNVHPDHPGLMDVYIQATRAAGAVRPLEETLRRRYAGMAEGSARARMAEEIGRLRLRSFEDPRGALEWFRRAIADDSEVFEAREGMVEALERLGDTAHMGTELELLISRYRATGRRGDASAAMCRLGRILITSGERKRGAELLRDALPDLPADNRPAVLLDLGRIFFDEKEFALARDMFARARQGASSVDHYRAALGEAESSLRIGDFQGAFEAAIAAGSGPSELRSRAVKAMAAAAPPLGKTAEALEVISRVAQNVPEPDAVELYELAAGMAWDSLRDAGAARRFYEAILEMDPESERARNKMIALLEASGDRVELARGLVRFAPRDGVADLLRAADFLSAEGLLDEAADALWKAYQVHPDAESARMLGAALRRSGRNDQMVDVLRRFAKDDEYVRDMLVEHLKDKGNTDEIVSLLSSVKGSNPAKERARLLTLADIALARGEQMVGAGHLLAAAELDKSHPEAGALFEKTARIALEQKHPQLLARCVDGLSKILGETEVAGVELSLALLYFGNRAQPEAEAALERALAHGAVPLDTWVKAARGNPGFAALVRAAEALAVDQGRWMEVEELLGLQMERARETERTELLRRRASLRETRLADRSGAADDLMALWRMGALSGDAVSHLMGMLEETGRAEDALSLASEQARGPEGGVDEILKAADLAARTGNRSAEKELLRQAVVRKSDAVVLFRLIALLDGPGERRELEQLLEKLGSDVSRLRPEDQRTILELELRMSEAQDRVDVLARLVKLLPAVNAYWEELMSLLESEGRWGLLASHMERRLELPLSPQDACSTWVALGRLNRDRLGDEDGAVAAFARAVDICAGHREASMALAEIYFRRGDYTALEGCLNALTEGPWHPDVVYWRARTAEERGDTAGALSLYRELVDRAPQMTGGLEGFLRTVDDGAEIDTVLLAWDALGAAASGALTAPMHRKIGAAFWTVKDAAQARRHFERADALAPGDAKTLFALVEVYRALGEFAAAARTLEKLAMMSAGDEQIDFYVGAARIYYDQLEDYRRAQSLYQEVARIAPREPDVLLGLADCAWKNGDFSVVTSNLERLRVVAPHFSVDPLRMFQFASSLSHTGEWPKADIIELLERYAPDLQGTDKRDALMLLARLRQETKRRN